MKKIFLLLWFVLLGLFEVQAYQFEKMAFIMISSMVRRWW